METKNPTSRADALRIGGKPFTPEETREIDEQIDKLDALISQRRTRVLEAMDAEECNCAVCAREVPEALS